ncbi:hypothetical protein ABIE67_007563 [Streptomyces sp. V4I8]|uniref:hypothetical protein n=1 Tax=Streptomyces sp. V4I8 TaxID=3156469 RepID=UPI0035137A25
MYSCPLCSFRSVPPRITTRERAGYLTLHALGRSLDAPDVTFLGRRQAHLSCRTRAELDVYGGSGGPAVRLDEVRVIARIGPLRSVVARSDKAPGPSSSASTSPPAPPSTTPAPDPTSYASGPARRTAPSPNSPPWTAATSPPRSPADSPAASSAPTPPTVAFTYEPLTP